MSRPFTDIFRDHRKGIAVDQATDMLAELIRAVDDTGKKGSLTIKLTVSPVEGGGSEKKVSIAVSSKKPVRDIPDAVFYSDSQGTLLRHDPSQTEMSLQQVKSAGSASN